MPSELTLRALLGHPPCGGCGLKLFYPVEGDGLVGGHPPCGGCGLKYRPHRVDETTRVVTLRVEGVD